MEKRNNLISCVIPLYNKEEFVARAIKSVLSQTYENLELLIINDGSTDNSVKIVEKFNDKRIKLINQVNSGVSVARNKGIEMSSGELIAFLDADDLWLPNHLSDISKLNNLFPCASAYSTNFKIMLKNGVEENSKLKGIGTSGENVIVENYCKSCVLSGGHLTGPINSSTAVLKKEIFQNIKGFNNKLKNNEDLDLWLRISEKFELAFTWKVSCKIDRTKITKRPLKTFDYRDNHIIITGYNILKNNKKNLNRKFWLYEYINKKKLSLAKNLIIHNKKWKSLIIILKTNTILFIVQRIFLLVVLIFPNDIIEFAKKMKNKIK